MQRAEPGDAKIHVSNRQLRDAFRRHHASGRNGADMADAHLLLLVYAVECGLKELLLRRRGIKNTSKLDRDDLTHDLDDLLKLLGQTPRFHGVKLQEPDEDVPAQRIHEALRYGRRLLRGSREKLLHAIREVTVYIEENMP